jgi:hypothetical protein
MYLPHAEMLKSTKAPDVSSLANNAREVEMSGLSLDLTLYVLGAAAVEKQHRHCACVWRILVSPPTAAVDANARRLPVDRLLPSR